MGGSDVRVRMLAAPINPSDINMTKVTLVSMARVNWWLRSAATSFPFLLRCGCEPPVARSSWSPDERAQ